jgi:acetyl-CoA decarbonylase/synthase complex subunit gamma
LKGAAVGLAAIAAMTMLWVGFRGESNVVEILGWFFLVPAAAAFLAMNFTGASTYTSLSGVRKEMKWAVPLEIGAGVLGLVLWVVSRLMA